MEDESEGKSGQVADLFLLQATDDVGVVGWGHCDVERQVVLLQQLAALALARRKVFLGEQQEQFARYVPCKQNT